MKKFIAFIIVLSMLLSFSVFATAENTTTVSVDDVVISYDADSIKLAKEFDVTVSINNNSDKSLLICSFYLNFGNCLELISWESKAYDGGPWEDEVFYKDEEKIQVSTNSDLMGENNGVFPGDKVDFIFTFKAINVGDVTLSVSEISCLDEFFDDVSFADITNSFTIDYPAKLKSASLNIGAGINLNFIAYVPEEYKDAQMCFTQDLVDDGTYEAEEPKYVSGEDSGTTGSFNGVDTPIINYYFGVRPDRINDSVHASLVYEGITIAQPQSYSVMTYCNRVFERGQSFLPGSTDEQYAAFEKLICDLVKYGIESQNYTGYSSAYPIEDAIYEGYSFSPSEFTEFECNDSKRETTEITDPAITGAALSLGGKFSLRFTVKTASAEGISFSVKEISDNGTRSGYVTGEHLVSTDEEGKYYLYITPAAKGIDYLYNITAYDANGNQADTVSYSVKAYVAKYCNGSSVSELVKALYCYGTSLRNYDSLMQ